jgi:lactate permease
MFIQPINPLNNVILTTIASLIPLLMVLGLLAGVKLSAWIATLIGSLITIIVGVGIWGAPLDGSFYAWLSGALVGFWNISWITIWGLAIYNVLVLSGRFEVFKNWLIRNSVNDVRVQAILLAWSFGALMEGLVGFGYPWAIVAPLLISLGFQDLKALKVSALANNAPVSYGALGTPIILLSSVTGLPLLFVSSTVGRVVAVLALLPTWVLLYLVDGKRGVKEAWPLALLGSLSYIAGQLPVSNFLGPYLPDITGSLISFGVLLLFLKVWRPRNLVSFSKALNGGEKEYSRKEVIEAWIPWFILIIVVTLWTGPWSPLTKVSIPVVSATAFSSLLNSKVTVSFAFNPFVAGTSILTSFVLISLFLRVKASIWSEALKRTFRQLWGAILTGFFVVGLAYEFNYSGMAYSLAGAASNLGLAFILISPILGWIACALSGSNTSSNALFGAFQFTVGKLLGIPIGLLPSLNSVGAELGKPVAPQTTSVGVSTTKYVRREGEVIRENMPWTFLYLFYLILIGLLYYYLLPIAMT